MVGEKRKEEEEEEGRSDKAGGEKTEIRGEAVQTYAE